MKAITLLLVLALSGAAGGTYPAELDGDAASGLALRAPNNAVEAAFTQRSYEAGETAVLALRPSLPGLRLRLFRAGAGHSGPLQGSPVGAWLRVRGRPQQVDIAVGHRSSGLYYAQLVTPERGSWYAPFVVRPARPARNRVLVVLPTNTWQAYNFEDGDSWYLDSSVHTVDLTRPYLDDGVPPHYRGYDRGFVRWLALHHLQPDFVTDDDLDRASAAALARDYDLIVFPGHEEYVTTDEFDVVDAYRDLGGNLAFLSSNDFFYKVVKSGEHMDGRWRWRDLGRPEASLVGAQYVDWNQGKYPNRPFTVIGRSGAPWLFAGTGLADGATFGVYGIEIDSVAPSSPPGTRVLATIHDIFGPGETAQMTYYTTPRGAKVFSAGVMNFGGSALWPVVSKLMGNLWAQLTRP
jgi:hypothetical protein